MNHPNPSALAVVLTLAEHGGAAREHREYGGPLQCRYLNVTGRWASTGTKAVPLLTWQSGEAAKADAAKASSARGRQVNVTSVAGDRFGCFAQYSDQHAGALNGYLPYSAAAARKLESERQRLMGYAKVVWAGVQAGPDVTPSEAVTAMKQAARSLQLTGIGNGSWVTAAQGLTGKRALDLFAMVFDGELPCDPAISPEEILKAVYLAKSLTTKA